MVREKIQKVLSGSFPAPAFEKVLSHYEDVATSFSRADWEGTLSATGKFIDAALRCLHYLTTGELLDDIDVGREIDRLQQVPRAAADESVRLLIPRVLRALYQIASDRGARHDRLSFDPNLMDATLAVHGVSWTLAELVRVCHSGVVQATEAQRLVSALVEPKFPLVEEVDGLTFLDKKDVSARDAILVKLRVSAARRVPREELFGTVDAHGHSLNNARATLSQLKRARLVHENKDGIRLLVPGTRAADEILSGGAN